MSGNRPVVIQRHSCCNTTVTARSLVIILPLIALMCGKPPAVKPMLLLSARLVEENGALAMIFRNGSTCELTFCKQNFYDPISCLDFRRHADTAEFTREQVFGKAATLTKRRIITLDDYCKLQPGQETRIPVDLRPVATYRKLGDTVLLAVYFRNIHPEHCSKVQVEFHDKATQDYCRLLHMIPTLDNNYWSGEIRTGYLPVRLRNYAPRTAAKKRKSSRVKVVRRSRTHPLDHSVF